MIRTLIILGGFLFSLLLTSCSSLPNFEPSQYKDALGYKTENSYVIPSLDIKLLLPKNMSVKGAKMFPDDKLLSGNVHNRVVQKKVTKVFYSLYNLEGGTDEKITIKTLQFHTNAVKIGKVALTEARYLLSGKERTSEKFSKSLVHNDLQALAAALINEKQFSGVALFHNNKHNYFAVKYTTHAKDGLTRFTEFLNNIKVISKPDLQLSKLNLHAVAQLPRGTASAVDKLFIKDPKSKLGYFAGNTYINKDLNFKITAPVKYEFKSIQFDPSHGKFEKDYHTSIDKGSVTHYGSFVMKKTKESKGKPFLSVTAFRYSFKVSDQIAHVLLKTFVKADVNINSHDIGDGRMLVKLARMINKKTQELAYVDGALAFHNNKNTVILVKFQGDGDVSQNFADIITTMKYGDYSFKKYTFTPASKQ